MQRRAFVQRFTPVIGALICTPFTEATAAAQVVPHKEDTGTDSTCNSESDQMNTNTRKAIVRRFNKEVIEEGLRSSFEELMDASFVNHSAPPGTPNGPESMWNTFQNILRPALSNLQVQINEQLCDGEKVTTRKSITGQHTGVLFGIAPTGRSISIDVIDIVRVLHERYVEHWGINTLPSVLAQLRTA